MRKALWLLTILLVASGCASVGQSNPPLPAQNPIQSRPFDDPSHPDAVSHVRVVRDPREVEACTFVKAISAMGFWGGKPRDLQTQAVALNANTVFIGTNPYTMGARLHGEAYRCEPTTAPTAVK